MHQLDLNELEEKVLREDTANQTEERTSYSKTRCG